MKWVSFKKKWSKSDVNLKVSWLSVRETDVTKMKHVPERNDTELNICWRDKPNVSETGSITHIRTETSSMAMTHNITWVNAHAAVGTINHTPASCLCFLFVRNLLDLWWRRRSSLIWEQKVVSLPGELQGASVFKQRWRLKSLWFTHPPKACRTTCLHEPPPDLWRRVEIKKKRDFWGGEVWSHL